MVIYYIGITLMLDMIFVAMQNDLNIVVRFLADVTTCGNLEALRKW